MDTQKSCYLFFDLDGTVLVDGKLPREHLDAMRAAQALGHKLILCTGRSCGMFELVRDLVKDVPWNGMIFGGADIRFEGEILSQKCFPPERVFEWLEFCMEHRYFFGYEGQVTFFPIKFHELKAPMAEEQKEHYRAWIKREMEEGNPPTKIAVFENRERLDVSKIPLSLDGAIVHERYIEIFAPDCNKGEAIKIFCQTKGVDVKQCVAFGDSLNDCDMFKVCPTSVCMKPSHEELVGMSSYHAKGDYGVAEGILWLFGDKIQLTNTQK